MPALDYQLVARDAALQLVKRKNFAGKNPGVILVFCIVFIIVVGLLGLFLYRKMLARRARRT